MDESIYVMSKLTGYQLDPRLFPTKLPSNRTKELVDFGNEYTKRLVHLKYEADFRLFGYQKLDEMLA